jgi:hypothetical protein
MRRGLARLRIAVLSAVLSLGIAGASPAAEADRTYPVGIKQLEFADAHYGPRTLSMAVFYPAVIDTTAAKRGKGRVSRGLQGRSRRRPRRDP